MLLHSRGSVLRRESLRLVGVALADAGDVVREHSRDPRDGARAWVARSLEQPLGGAQDGGDVALAPRVGEREAARLGPRGDERLNVRSRDALTGSPRYELVCLGRELVEVGTDEVDECPAGVGVGGAAAELELVGNPRR